MVKVFFNEAATSSPNLHKGFHLQYHFQSGFSDLFLLSSFVFVYHQKTLISLFPPSQYIELLYWIHQAKITEHRCDFIALLAACWINPLTH